MDQGFVDTIVGWLQELGLEFVVGTFVLVAIFIVFLFIQGPLSRSRGSDKPPPDDPGGSGGSPHQ